MNETLNKPEKEQEQADLGSGKTGAETESGSFARDDVQKGVFQDADDLETFDEAGAFQSGVSQGDVFEPEPDEKKDSE